jgi:serpin B
MLGSAPQAVPAGEVAATVNAWVARATDGQIERLLEDGAPDARLIAASAVAFRGRWETRFEPEATRPAMFRPATGGQVETPLMAVRLTASALLGRELRAVMLPYAGTRYGFVALRRTARSRTAPTLGQLYASVAALPDGSAPGTRWATRDVAVRLPRFTLEVGGDVADALARGGYSAVIGTTLDAAATEPVLIREVIHKARIAVDEEGTTAAAATAAVGIRTMTPPPEELVFDQPFAFAVVDLARRLPVFAGVLNTPPR